MQTPAPAERVLLATIDELSRELRPGRRPAVSLDSSLERDLGLDSLARVELLGRLETRLHVALPEPVLVAAETPRDLLRAVSAAEAPRAPITTVEAPVEPLREAEPAPATIKTLVEMLVWHAQRHPDRPHVRVLRNQAEETLTCAELLRESQTVAAGLQALGIRPGQSVAIMLPTSRDYFVSFFGVLLAGAVPVPIYPPARPSQIEDHVRRHTGILANAAATALITVPEAKPVARLLRARLERMARVCIVEELKADASAFRAPAVAAADTALMQYTSGSTGNPKGVVLTHANLLANIRAVGDGVRAEPTDVFVSWLPLYHDMGLIGAWLATLYHAIPLVVMSPVTFLLRPSRWLWAIHRYRGTLSASPNFGYELCLRRIADDEIEGLDLSSLRVAFNGAEAVSPATVDRFCERFRRHGFRREAMMPVYGLAECAVGLAFPPLNRGPLIDRVQRDAFVTTRRAAAAAPEDLTALRFVACGQPLPGYEIRVADETGRELPERVEGRVQFRGPSTTSGYFRNPEATRKLFVGDWLDSGDLGYIAEGDVFITGRIKDIIIHAGRNIYPDEVEEAVGDLPGIRKGRVAVFGSPDPVSGTERLVVMAETRETDAAARAALTTRINGLTLKLTGTAPDDVCLAPPQTILKTSSGKLRRAASRALYAQGGIGRSPPSFVRQLLRLLAGTVAPRTRAAAARVNAFLYAAYAWALFLLMAPAVWLIVMVLPKPEVRWRALRAGARLLARACRTPVVVQGREHLPPPDRPCVIVANHASYLDGYALVAALPHPIGFVAKAEFQHAAVIGPFLRRIGCLFVERFDRSQGIADARRLVGAARAGQWLLFFPEGTFTRAPGLAPFHMGAFIAAAEARLPVVPITLRGTRSILRDGSWFPRRGAVTVTVGPPLDPEVFRPEASDAWTLALRLRTDARREMLRTGREPDLAAQ
jgi:1-acyl-sn-glycerol-3-phosphate acyltransferase